MKILLSSFLFTCFCTIALSQQPIWTATAPIEGGAISKVWVDSLGNVYAGADGLYRSTNHGLSWQQIQAGIDGGYISNFSVNHQGHIFVLTNIGLYRSTDNGESWSSVYGFFEAYSVLTTTSGKIFVGASQDWGIGRFYRSTDNGVTWSYIDPLRYSVFSSLVINSSGHLFGGGYGVLKSTNDGTTWDSVNTGIFGSRYVPALAIDQSGSIYASVYNNGVFKTTNAGESWSQVGLPGVIIDDLSIARNGFIYAATDSGVFRSTNSGLSWIQFNNGLSNKNIMSVAPSASSDVFAGTFGSGMFRSSNFGIDWQQSTSGITQQFMSSVAIDRNTNTVYVGVGVGGGVFRSSNGGTLWNPAGLQGVTVNRLAIKPNRIIFASTSSAIYSSSNEGIEWKNTNFPRRQLTDRKVVFTPTGNVFATIDSSIYRSTNDGQTWTRTNNGLSAQHVWDIVTTNNGFLLVIVSRENENRHLLYRSTDEGNSWYLVGTGIAERLLFRVGTSPTGEVYAAGDSLFRSTNNGETFSFASKPFPSYHSVYVMAFNSVGHIYVSTDLLLISRSTNGGLNWESYTSGITGRYVNDIATDDNNLLYAATDRGVFRTLMPTTSIESSPRVLPNEFVLHQNYPNPFNPETNISFDLPKSSFVTMKIFNLIGQEVATIVNAQLEVGAHSYRVSGEKFGLSSGVYLYKMVTGEFVQTKKMILMK